MMQRAISLTLILVLGFSPFVVGEATARAEKARISLAEARKIALARVPGTIVHEKLKTKKHHHPIYSIKIQSHEMKTTATVKKIEIDGDTGKIVKVKDVAAKAKPDKKSDKKSDKKIGKPAPEPDSDE